MNSYKLKYNRNMTLEKVIGYARQGLLEMDNPCEVIMRVYKEASNYEYEIGYDKGYNDGHFDGYCFRSEEF